MVEISKADDEFEKIWADCACGQSNDGRIILIQNLMEIGTLVHAEFVERGVCPTMMPNAMGMLVSIVIGIQQKIENPNLPQPLLSLPGIPGRLENAIVAARALINSAGEVQGCA